MSLHSGPRADARSVENLEAYNGRANAHRSDRCGSRLTAPDQDPAVLIHRHALAVDELVLEDLQLCLIQLELELEGPIGQATPLAQEGDDLIQDRHKVRHFFPLSCVGAAWACTTP